jgi:hypothetical protein
MELRASGFVWKGCDNPECEEYQKRVFYPTRLIYIDEGKSMAYSDLSMKCLSCGNFLPPEKSSSG